MSDTGFAKAGFNHILDSLVLTGNTNDHLTIKKVTFVGPPIRLVPSVSSSVDTDLSRASEIKLIEADFTFKSLNNGQLYIQFT